jgi:hypothetical protein
MRAILLQDPMEIAQKMKIIIKSKIIQIFWLQKESSKYLTKKI